MNRFASFADRTEERPRRARVPRTARRASRQQAGATGWWGNARGAAVSTLLTLAMTVSYGTVAAGSLAPLRPGLAAAMVLSALIAASLGALVASAMGPAPMQIFSPRASVAVVISAAAVSFAAGGDLPVLRVAGLLASCLLLAALMQLAFAALGLGGLIRLVPHSVAAGLVMALAFQLAWSQLPGLLGSTQAMPAVAPLVTGLATLVTIVGCRRRYGAGVALVAGVVVGLLTGAVVGHLMPGALPHLPAIDLREGPLLSLALAWRSLGADLPASTWTTVFGFAAVIALINSFETLTSAMQLEELGRGRIDPNRALLASACGSLASVCAGGLPVAGSSSTSAAHVQAGARSRSAALVAALLVGLCTLALGQAMARVPLAVVAGLLLLVAFDLAMSPARELVSQWRADRLGMRGELALALLVSGLLLWAGIFVALGAGLVAASALAFVRMRAGLVRREYDATDNAMPELLRTLAPDEAAARDIVVIELGQPLFFATAEAAVRAVERASSGARFTLLDLGASACMDATAARALARCAADLARQGRELLLVGPTGASDLKGRLQPCLVFDHLGPAVRHCLRQAQLGPGHPDTPPWQGDVPPATVSAIRPVMAADRARRAEREAVPAALPGQTAGPSRGTSAPTEAALDTVLPHAASGMFPPAGSAGWLPSPATMKVAATMLAPHVGPMSGLLVRRAAGTCSHPDQFCQALAQHIDTRSARESYVQRLRACVREES